MHDHREEHDLGLRHDLPLLLRRRRVLGLLGGAGLGLVLGGCGDVAGDGVATGGASAADGGALVADCAAMPPETPGPFPANGTADPSVLVDAGVVRRDIRSSFATGSATAEGVELTFELVVQDFAPGCTAYPGAAVYLWHCDAPGRYSLYEDPITGEDYLRGVQVADAAGLVRFTSVFPGCYPGRWPHAHFEVYADEQAAVSGAAPVATSQLALPRDVCEQVYADARYGDSAGHLSRLSLERDGVFADDVGGVQLATVTGSPDAGLLASLVVPV